MKNFLVFTFTWLLFTSTHIGFTEPAFAREKAETLAGFHNEKVCRFVVTLQAGALAEVGFLGLSKSYGTSEALNLKNLVLISKTYADFPGCGSENCPPSEKFPKESFATETFQLPKELQQKGQLKVFVTSKKSSAASVELSCTYDGKTKITGFTVELKPGKVIQKSLAIP